MEHIFNNHFPYFVFDKQIFIQYQNKNIQDNFQLLQQSIGQGGYGKVYKAIQKNSHVTLLNQNWQSQIHTDSVSAKFRNYPQVEDGLKNNFSSQRIKTNCKAVKKINVKKVKDHEMLKQQINILTFLDHPRVSRLYDSFIFKQNLYLVQDLLGPSLFDQIQKVGKISQQQARNVFRQMLQATEYLHSKFLSHRDFKMQNFLFLNPNEEQSPPIATSPFMGKLVLIDFGLTYSWEQDMRKQIRASSQKNKIIGTSYYIAPEILDHSYDQKCDIWSLGVILFALLTGKPFIDGADDQQILRNIKKLRHSDFFKKNKYFQNQIFLNREELQGLSEEVIDLLNKILQPEQIRIQIQDIKKHSWLRDPTENQGGNQFITQKLIKITEIQRCKIKLSELKLSDILTKKLIDQYCSLNQFQKMQCLYFSTRISINQICKHNLDVKYKQMLNYMKELELKNTRSHKKSYCSSKSMDTDYTNSKNEEDQQDEQFFNFNISKRSTSTSQKQVDLGDYIFKIKLSQSAEDELAFSQFLAFYIFSEYKQKKLRNEISFFCEVFSDKNVKKTFQIYDKDKDGYVSIKDLSIFFKENGIQKQNMGRLKSLMKTYYSKQKISFQQYKRLILCQYVWGFSQNKPFSNQNLGQFSD